MITKEDILFSKKNQQVCIAEGFTSNILNWEDAFNLFKIAKSKNSINFNSYWTCTIDKSEHYTRLYKDLIKEISLLHPGEKISAFSIINLITKNSNIFNSFKDYFINSNPNKIPNEELLAESFIPPKHTDPVDGFFIQFEGSTLWKIYYKDNEKQYTLKSGDMIFIPKNLEHSVEALEPRCSVSISFTDGESAI